MSTTKAVKITIFHFMIFTVFTTTFCHAGVVGKVNKFYEQRLPKTIIVLAMAVTEDEKVSSLLAVDVFKKYGFSVVSAKEAFPCVEQDYFFNATSDCLQKTFIEDVIKNNKLPVPVAARLMKFPEIEGVLLMNLANFLFWKMDPVLQTSQYAMFQLYDTKTGEWVYTLQFECGEFPLIPISKNKCSVDRKGVLRYLNGDMKKKFQKVKFK